MRFKLDENIPAVLAAELIAAGHDSHTCLEEGIVGEDDSIVATCAKAESRVLITNDLDFADIRIYPPGTHPGIILVRVGLPNIPKIRAALSRVLSSLSESEIQRNLVVVDDRSIRIRRPTP